jgi:hypothetical protein
VGTEGEEEISKDMGGRGRKTDKFPLE